MFFLLLLSGTSANHSEAVISQGSDLCTGYAWSLKNRVCGVSFGVSFGVSLWGEFVFFF